MDFFIKKIFDDCADDLVHLQFKKFGKGEYKNRAMIKASKRSFGFSVSTSYEYANELVRFTAEKLEENKTNVKGVIVSTKDLSKELNYEDKPKQFMGIKQYKIEKEMSGKDIIDLCDKIPNAFFGLSFSNAETDLKIKPKSPKSSKPPAKGEKKQVPDFCKIKTKDVNLVIGLIFDKDNFKDAEVEHSFVIEKLIIPEDEEDLAKMRENAKRVGKIVRKAIFDGEEVVSEKDFVV